MWNEARELAVFCAYLNRVPLSVIMRDHGIKDATVSDLVRRRLVRLRKLGLHRALELAGCPLDCIETQRAPEYIELYELSRKFLFDDQIEQLWFSTFRKP